MLLEDLFLEIALGFRFVRWIFSCSGLLFRLRALPRQDLAAVFRNLRARALTSDATAGMHAANANAG
jgi:hypothetical protein